VVLYSPRHNSTLAGESRDHIYNLIRVWTDRYRDLATKPFIKYVYIFENKGEVIGVTLKHPHGQIYAFPFIPPKIATELRAERRYKARTRRCLCCDIVKDELKGKSRLVTLNRSFAAYIPFFARYPYEIHVTSRRHLGHLGQMTDAEHWDLAEVLKTVMAKYDRLYGFSFPYIMLMKQTPTDGGAHPYHHFRIEFYPPHRSKDKIKYLAGCESGAGTFITDTIPEAKAAELRSVPPRTT
jgi:UDPglucose--hexose-1-phosphate uridylyltransferase